MKLKLKKLDFKSNPKERGNPDWISNDGFGWSLEAEGFECYYSIRFMEDRKEYDAHVVSFRGRVLSNDSFSSYKGSYDTLEEAKEVLQRVHQESVESALKEIFSFIGGVGD